MPAQPQSSLRLWWVASYYDGTTIYESEHAGEISSEDIDRHALKRFSLVNADGEEVYALDFLEGDDPKLVYRRRSFAGAPALTSDGIPLSDVDPDTPEWLVWEWSYLLGRHFSNGHLELFSMNADGAFEPEQDALRCITGHERQNDEIEWKVDSWGPAIALELDFNTPEIRIVINGDTTIVYLPAQLIPAVTDSNGDVIEPEALGLAANAKEVADAVNASDSPIKARAIGTGHVFPTPVARVSDVELVGCERF